MRNGGRRRFALLAVLTSVTLGLTACMEAVGGAGEEPSPEPLFEQVAAEVSGLTFANRIVEDLEINMVTFEYLFNGGGVSLGDVDGDGLPDVFLTATQGPNRLYLNRGEFRFEDATEQAGVAGRDTSMTTGTTMADVDGDGDLDLYVCQTGKPEWAFDRRNLLYINDGHGRFTEQGEEAGLASEGFSNHATFFDYDVDGDLDLYLVNHPPDFSRANEIRDVRSGPEPFSSDQLFRNDSAPGAIRFTDVSEQAGIRNFAFGLSATVSDYNDDGWPDILVANDYVLPDFLYINDGDGTFTDRSAEAFPHSAASGMGSDAADINNDGLLDIVIVDMMAEDARRQRILATSMMYDRYQILRRFGYGDQVQRNMLHLNNGDGTYAEVGYLAGIAETDWSWSPLLADFDLDGDRDLFIANGYRREVTNLDYVKFTLDSLRRAGGGKVRVRSIDDYLQHVPSERLQNYAYANQGDLRFEDVSQAWGLADRTHSSGAAYGDLDGDGDLDLVVNDVDGPVRLYRNRSETLAPERRWLTVRFDGPPGNPYGIGARVTVEADTLRQIGENVASRGFFSSVAPELHFGLGAAEALGVTVRWPDGRTQLLQAVPANQALTVHYNDASERAPQDAPGPLALFEEADPAALGLDFRHQEDGFVDFKRDLLIPHMHSREGPALATADANGDGLDDLFVGGAVGQAGVLYLQTTDGRFQPSGSAPWARDLDREDVHAVFLDADGDGLLDLYVASGGSHFTADQVAQAEMGLVYQDRLYLGDGQGGFRHAPAGALPPMPTPTGAVALGDGDGDGDLDLFVGGRVVSGRYPESPRSVLLLNESRPGAPRFIDETQSRAPGLSQVGLVTASAWADLDGDGSDELVVTGEWMEPQVWRRGADGRFARVQENGLDGLDGWWSALAVADLDGDGDLDLVGGNLGLNSRLHASAEHPMRIYARDFDGNGSLDPILTLIYPDGQEYPIHRREEITKQLPYLQQRFPRFGPYASATIREVFTEAELRPALMREAHHLASTWFENAGDGRFIPHQLPIAAQVAPLYALAVRDLDGDGHLDLVAGGNNRSAHVERGPYDALRGLALMGRSGGGWTPQPSRISGLRLPGDVRALAWVETPTGPVLVVANNDAPLAVYRLRAARLPS